MTPKPSEQCLTQEQLAERWQIHPITLANWRVKGKGPKFHKIGKKVMYPISEVERYEQDKLQRSTADIPGGGSADL